MRHTCHHPLCDKPVPAQMLACRGHWYSLRSELRDAIWKEYRPGQETDKAPSARYVAVQRLACAEWLFKPNDEAAARAAAPYILDAELHRALAVKEGKGDPLVMLVATAPNMALLEKSC